MPSLGLERLTDNQVLSSGWKVRQPGTIIWQEGQATRYNYLAGRSGNQILSSGWKVRQTGKLSGCKVR